MFGSCFNSDLLALNSLLLCSASTYLSMIVLGCLFGELFSVCGMEERNVAKLVFVHILVVMYLLWSSVRDLANLTSDLFCPLLSPGPTGGLQSQNSTSAGSRSVYFIFDFLV